MDNKKMIYLPLMLILLIGQASYFARAQNRKVKLGETFTLQSGELAETEDGKLKIQSKGVGRTISESGEVEYVVLQVTFNKSKRLIDFREGTKGTKTVGNFVIKLVNAESFGKPKCQLKISRKVVTKSRKKRSGN